MMKLRLSWTDPVSQRFRRPLLNVPVALGHNFDAMPGEAEGQWVSRMVIGDRQIDDFHALIVEIEGQIYLIKQGGQTHLNGRLVSEQTQLEDGDCIRIGQTELQLEIMAALQAVSRPPAVTYLQVVPDPVSETAPVDVQDDALNDGLGDGHGDANDGGRQAERNASSGHGSLNNDASDRNHHTAETNGHIAETNGHVAQTKHVAKANGHVAKTKHVAETNGHVAQTRHVAETNGHIGKSNLPTHGPIVGSNEHSPVMNGFTQSNGLAHPLSSPRNAQAPATPPPLKPVVAASSGDDATPQPSQQPLHDPNSGCRRMVGFLFKRPCGRSNKMGCHHCAKGYSHQAYQADYELYEGFGRYESGDWGYSLLVNPENR